MCHLAHFSYMLLPNNITKSLKLFWILTVFLPNGNLYQSYQSYPSQKGTPITYWTSGLYLLANQLSSYGIWTYDKPGVGVSPREELKRSRKPVWLQMASKCPTHLVSLNRYVSDPSVIHKNIYLEVNFVYFWYLEAEIRKFHFVACFFRIFARGNFSTQIWSYLKNRSIY